MTGQRPAQEREAFNYWYSEAKKSVKKTALDLDIPERTVYHWRKTYGWDDEYRQIVAPMAAEGVYEARTTIRLALSDVAEELLRIVRSEAADDKDKINAARVLFAQAGDMLSEKDAKHLTFVDARQIVLGQEETKELSTEDLRRQATRAIEANVSTTQKSARPGKRNSW